MTQIPEKESYQEWADYHLNRTSGLGLEILEGFMAWKKSQEDKKGGQPPLTNANQQRQDKQ